MGQRAKHDIAPMVRGAFLRALEIQDKSGRPFPVLLSEAIDEHGILAVLDKVSKFTVKEKHTKHDHTVKIGQAQTDSLSQWLNGFQAGANAKIERLSEGNSGLTEQSAGQTSENAVLVQDGSLLSTEVRAEPEGRREPVVIQQDKGSPGEPE
jgi:hypothetical protein